MTQGDRAFVAGRADEQALFAARNAKFLEVWPRLQCAIENVFSREFVPATQADLVVYVLGRLAVEDFMEIVLCCANGYGIGGLKLLRPMFEATVTGLYLARNPGEVEMFTDYHKVHQRKTLKIADSIGLTLPESAARQRSEIDNAYEMIKHRYLQSCPRCGAERESATWTKKDLTTLAREVGLEHSVLGLSFLPTLQIHATPARMMSRIEDTPLGLRFKAEAQRREADASLVGAHICLSLVLKEQNRFFSLGLADQEELLRRDFEHAWPRPGPLAEGATDGEL